MDCSTAYVPTNVVQDSPDCDSSSSDDLVPLSTLLERHVEKPSRKNKHGLTRSSIRKSKKAKVAFDESSDDKPLSEMKKASGPAQKRAKENDTSTRNGKDADDEGSNNKPFVKMTKVTAKAMKKLLSTPPKQTPDTTKKESLDNCDASDDEPLSVLAKKCYPKRKRRPPAQPLRNASPQIKSKRNASRKSINYAETSSDGSDDEPLETKKGSLTKSPLKEKTSANSKDKKRKAESQKDSSDDDAPLENLITKKEPVGKNAKNKARRQASASRKTQGSSDESSEDEAVIDLKKKRPETRKKTSAPKRRSTSRKKPRKRPAAGSSSNSSGDELFKNAAQHPQVTRIVTVILKRCDGKETGDHKA